MIANISSQYLVEITAVLGGDYCSTWAKYWRTYFWGRNVIAFCETLKAVSAYLVNAN